MIEHFLKVNDYQVKIIPLDILHHGTSNYTRSDRTYLKVNDYQVEILPSEILHHLVSIYGQL